MYCIVGIYNVTSVAVVGGESHTSVASLYANVHWFMYCANKLSKCFSH